MLLLFSYQKLNAIFLLTMYSKLILDYNNKVERSHLMSIF